MGAEILGGRAKSVSAKHYLINNIDELIKYYDNGWSEILVMIINEDNISLDKLNQLAEFFL